MASPRDLTTLTNLRTSLNVSGNEAELGRLISVTSSLIYGYLNQEAILPGPVTEVVDGSGSQHRLNADGPGGWRTGFRRRPVLEVTSLSIDGVSIDEAAALAPGVDSEGWYLDPWDGATMPPPAQFLTLRGRSTRFRHGRRNIALAYVAGFQVTAEPATVSDAHAVTVKQLLGSWGSDRGVSYSNGTPFVAVAGAPAQGQYSVNGATYTFNAADDGQAVLVSYGFIPFDIEEACIQTVIERYRAKDRVGVLSQGLAGQETVTYSPYAMSLWVKALLDNYRDPVFA